MIRREEKEIFGTAFLDVISCGLGAVILMILLAKDGGNEDIISDYISNLSRPESIPLDVALKQEVIDLEYELRKLTTRSSQLSARLAQKVAEIARLEAVIESIPKIEESGDIGSMDSIYTGGIPVGSEYVIFIIDSSGSMKQNWAVVTSTMRGILAAHPRVKGMQIMNDNGNYLIDGYAQKWIPDTSSARKRALEKFANWSSFSNSSPAEGLETALKTYAQRQEKVSIYVLGDDFTGASYEVVTRVIDRWNINKTNGERRAIIHGIGFPWGLGDRFSTLMREVAVHNGGVFIALQD
ncbi:MAG: hypothetical protein NZ811_04090 [Gammaproteobacteria bacterium]|nr:hypothetical protein [Gammaproteobacteria bacterium]